MEEESRFRGRESEMVKGKRGKTMQVVKHEDRYERISTTFNTILRARSG